MQTRGKDPCRQRRQLAQRPKGGGHRPGTLPSPTEVWWAEALEQPTRVEGDTTELNRAPGIPGEPERAAA